MLLLKPGRSACPAAPAVLTLAAIALGVVYFVAIYLVTR